MCNRLCRSNMLFGSDHKSSTGSADAVGKSAFTIKERARAPRNFFSFPSRVMSLFHISCDESSSLKLIISSIQMTIRSSFCDTKKKNNNNNEQEEAIMIQSCPIVTQQLTRRMLYCLIGLSFCLLLEDLVDYILFQLLPKMSKNKRQRTCPAAEGGG